MDLNQDKEGYLSTILEPFQINHYQIEPFGTGLINQTWKVLTENKNYILQRVNDFVFKRPQDIDHNIQLLDNYLKKHHPEYFFVAPTKTRDGQTICFIENKGWFRLIPFVEESFTLTVVETADQAYEAAAQFGQFTYMLSGLDAEALKITIPDFHNLSLRFDQFEKAVNYGNPDRIYITKNLIHRLYAHADIVKEYNKRIAHPQFKKRTTHHDTKISNVLFDSQYKGLCVIDLDTVMPGYFFSDVGDMMRTYLSPVSEEEKDFSLIEIRRDVYDAVVSGYRDRMKDELTEDEAGSFHFAGRFMIYMQALRFLTDYLNNDIYYGSKYEGHNFIRAENQTRLLEKLEEIKD